MSKQKGTAGTMLKGLILQASDTKPLEQHLTASGLAWRSLASGSGEAKLLEAAKELGAPEELLCLVEADEDERVALEGGFFCIGYLNPQRQEEKLSGCLILLEGFEEIDRTFLEEIHTRALGLPVTIAETERLLIREMALSDLPDINALCLRNDFPAMGEEEAKAYIEYMYGLYQCGMWLVFEKKSGQLIGRCGFGVADYLDFSEMDLGYLIDRKCRRQGYAEEACRAVLAYGEQVLQFSGLSAYAEEENLPSRSLLEKLGFSRIQSFQWKDKTMHRYLRKTERTGEEED